LAQRTCLSEAEKHATRQKRKRRSLTIKFPAYWRRIPRRLEGPDLSGLDYIHPSTKQHLGKTNAKCTWNGVDETSSPCDVVKWNLNKD